ncbi:DUF6348 family protein [Chryseobacterium defluvii]|uniref:Uncharacterized protein n=1 Tax=Chryseobacterium defluvii TaxID=160396 RepID=A0A495SMI0_9FLAO|nr:DUF6348 family protein [Chryseobacterium defluvii]RKT01423.1 hypothetical protein BCF58_0643 [Chryseobacterium defluvii]
MGFFDFLKKKQNTENKSKTKESAQPQSDPNVLLLDTLKNRLIDKGYEVEWHSKYLALIINSELEIATVILDRPDYHPLLMHLMIITIHPTYFPDGIAENIVGIGNTVEEKIDSVLNNYLNTTFEPIIDSFSDTHDPELDFEYHHTLWHPKLGNTVLQGDWEGPPKNEFLFELLKDKISQKLKNSKLNWLKIYISDSNGTITGECLFNNEPWEEGLALLSDYIQSLNNKKDFIGLKQFIMFRKCGASE